MYDQNIADILDIWEMREPARIVTRCPYCGCDSSASDACCVAEDADRCLADWSPDVEALSAPSEVET